MGGFRSLVSGRCLITVIANVRDHLCGGTAINGALVVKHEKGEHKWLGRSEDFEPATFHVTAYRTLLKKRSSLPITVRTTWLSATETRLKSTLCTTNSECPLLRRARHPTGAQKSTVLPISIGITQR